MLKIVAQHAIFRRPRGLHDEPIVEKLIIAGCACTEQSNAFAVDEWSSTTSPMAPVIASSPGIRRGESNPMTNREGSPARS